MSAYYNEHDPYAANWLRNLISAGHIASGEVDERSIEDVFPDDLRGFTQCHFFAGIGGWSLALRLAGWGDDRPVWTGSCPCQPFSAAGKGLGTADERHLWPAWLHLIRECRPGRIYGEQVASRDALGWWDVVHDDLEEARYACGAFDLCAAGVGAPHIRQRLYWLADRDTAGRGVERRGRVFNGERPAQRNDAHGCGASGLLALTADARPQGCDEPGQRTGAQRAAAERGGEAGELGDARMHDGAGRAGEAHGDGTLEPHRPSASFWAAADWIDCRDGKRRPTEPGTFPLAHGATARVGRLRAYGNAICVPLASEFIKAAMTC